MFRVLNTLDLSGCPEVLDYFDGVATVETVDPSYPAVLDRIADADAYLAALAVRVDKDMIERASQLRVIGSPATGTDHLDLEAISDAGIPCFDIATEYALLNGFTATSELAFGLILMLARHIREATASASRGVWARESYAGFQLAGKKLGVLGMGRLGKISTTIAHGFGMEVLAHDPVHCDIRGVEWVEFDALFARSDIVSVHVHLRPETRHLVDARALSLMQGHALLINTSRGGVVDEEALLRALQDRQIGGAGLDVIDGEWESSLDDHPLIKYSRSAQNLVITPHMGGATAESIFGARDFMARKVADFLRGQV